MKGEDPKSNLGDAVDGRKGKNRATTDPLEPDGGKIREKD